MKLTDNYIEVDYYDYFVYFKSDLFGPDTSNLDSQLPGWHGEQLALWLNSHLAAKGFSLSSPTRDINYWSMILELDRTAWDVVCENLKYSCTANWKISIASRLKDTSGKGGSPPEICLPFSFECRDLLCENNRINSIEWNRADLNCP